MRIRHDEATMKPSRKEDAMRTRGAMLLILAAAASSAVAASAQPLPGAGYVWAQPGTSLVGVTTVQPVTSVARSMLPARGYVWAQLGTSPDGVTTTQPA
jgi:hypothetical protein